MSLEKEFKYTPLPEPIVITEQEWPEGTLPLVHTRTMTYNHENYIRECIEGILIQKTTFPVQVLIHDDASTDKTADIVREYALKHPRLIKAYYQTENSFTKVDKHERRLEFKSWRIGKYEAICEGDDYWTDPLKLQKQVDFLEENPNNSLCFHNAMVLQANGKMKEFFSYAGNKTFETVDFFRETIRVPTLSIVVRRDCLSRPLWTKYVQQGDLALELLVSLKGPIYFIDDIMGIYRRHSTSLGATTSIVKTELKKFELMSYFDVFTNFTFHNEISLWKEEFRDRLYHKYLIESGKYKKYFNIDFLMSFFKKVFKDRN